MGSLETISHTICSYSIAMHEGLKASVTTFDFLVSYFSIKSMPDMFVELVRILRNMLDVSTQQGTPNNG